MSDDTENNDQNNIDEAPNSNIQESASPMQDNPAPYSGGFGVISSIKDGLGVYAKNFTNLTILMLLYQLAIYSVTYIQTGHFAAASPTLMQDGASNYILTMIISLAIGAIFSIAALFGALCSLNGRQINISTMLARAINIWPRAFPTQLIVLLLTILGLIFLIVPGIMVALMLLPISAVLAWENLGVMASLDRARALTNGYKWPLFGLMLVISIPIILIAVAFIPASGVAVPTAPTPSATIANILVTSIFSGALNSIVAVVYMQLKNENG